MKKCYRKNKSGSTFIIVIGVLAIIIFAATMFMSTTVQEGRQTSMSIKGLHASSLAEASLERAMRILTEKINKVEPSDSKAEDLGIMLRLPATEGSSTYGQSENFGTDKELNLPELAKKEMVLTKDDLQADGNDLDELVKYMTDDGADSYEVTVKAKVLNGFRNSPGKDYSDFKVPGVDIGWNLRWDVNSFLSGEGYTAMDIKIPEGIKWLSFSIPIKIGPIQICNINVTSALGKLLPDVTIGGKSYSIDEFTEFDTLADILLNHVIAKDQKVIYPIKVKMDKVSIPKNVTEMWPSGVGISEASGQYLEKYGQIAIECEAKITYKDKYTSARRVSAVKEYKVADCEPPAPMYSFFVNNLKNQKFSFNNYGGQFTVNSYDYTGVLRKITETIKGNVTPADEAEEKEYPGLIRINYKDTSTNGKNPIICNVGLFGDCGATQLEGETDGTFSTLFGGIEGAMILSPESKMAIVGAKKNINTGTTPKEPESNEKVPEKMVDSTNSSSQGSSDAGKEDETTGKYSDQLKELFAKQPAEEKKDEAKSIGDKLKSLGSKALSGINLVPNVGEMSTNVISLAITLAVKPLASEIPVVGSSLGIPDCFESWDMPYMGTENRLYPIPTMGTGVNKTHLFGKGGFHPTMSKEIEGNVMKSYRQWSMCIVGMNPTDRLPLLPFAPVYLPPPPLVIPIWKAGNVWQKYDFNLENFKAHDDTGRPEEDCYEYDPSKLENMAPNLYTNEQYAKKATYYYENYQAFLDDLPNRTAEVSGGKTAFVLNGITYISGSLGDANNPFTVDSGTLYVVGKGMIICSGNIYLGSNIVAMDRSEDEHTVFTLMSRKGGLLIMNSGKYLKVEGSVYTDKGIYVTANSSLHIIGNWVTNSFNKPAMGGSILVDYVSSRVRTSLGSLHPTKGKYDPRRYHVSFSPTWSSWRSY